MEDDARNVTDYYKYWKTEAIVADLDTKRLNYGVLACNVVGDFNLGGIIRSANAFLAREVIIYGRKRYDRRGTVGTHTYTHFRHVREAEDLTSVLGDYNVVIGVDNIDRAIPIQKFVWPCDKRILLCFGEEHGGLAPEVVEKCHHLVYIDQLGSVRSLNVASAASIAMYDLVYRGIRHE